MPSMYVDHPLTDAQWLGLSMEEKHFYAVAHAAHRQGLPLVTQPSKHILPERAQWIAGLFGFSVPGQKATQAEMFAQSTMEAL